MRRAAPSGGEVVARAPEACRRQRRLRALTAPGTLRIVMRPLYDA
ncbi:hypothetical protein HMPREF9057_00188 [Actinomyces sp. oral taxon 171 str. F0337]|nr:hypothetical protein HMPREF9057_00188 [Actinomyces sp. oral taxon 171 str. F0337]